MGRAPTRSRKMARYFVAESFSEVNGWNIKGGFHCPTGQSSWERQRSQQWHLARAFQELARASSKQIVLEKREGGGGVQVPERAVLKIQLSTRCCMRLGCW
jgi:N-methylhydantoinase B/oxoprolinase/acetone carboxylase alpha subunit